MRLTLAREIARELAYSAYKDPQPVSCTKCAWVGMRTTTNRRCPCGAKIKWGR